MSVLTIYYAGQIGVEPARAAFDAPESTLAEVVTTGFLNNQPNAFTLQTGDFVFAKCSDGSALVKVTNTGKTITLTAISNPFEVAQVGDAVIGNIPKYATTTGDIEDSDIPADTLVTISGASISGNLPVFDNTTGEVKDSGVVASSVLISSSTATDYQEFVPLTNILINSVGTWTRTRVAAGNYSLVHTPADDTSVIGIDITPSLRAATGLGFELASMDVVYTIATLALDAHTIALNSTAYANNVAVAVTSVPLTGSLSTATQANPYVTNLPVTTPGYLNTAAAKYNVELTVNAAATSVYSFYGLNLHFTKSVA